MERRAFVTALMSGRLASPRATRAQAPAVRVVKVGVLRAAPDASIFRRNFDMLRQVLGQGGFIEGRNRKTAASLGLTVPRSLLARADKVIE